MCMPPKKSKIKARRVALRGRAVIRRDPARWRNNETGLVRVFWTAPTRGSWTRVLVRYG